MTRTDPILKLIVLVLVLAGFFILASASIGITASRGLPPYHFLTRQLLWGGLVGFLALTVTVRIPYRFWRKLALPFFLLSLGLTLLVFVPGIGLEHGGARRWLALGPVSFQPSELLKFGYLLYLAALFSYKPKLAPFLFITVLVSVIFILEPDVGSLGVTVLTGLMLFLVAGAKFRQILFLILLGVGLFLLLIWLEPYRWERILVFLNPDYNPQGAGYQIKQALIAIGSGGIFGRGFGMSRQKFQYLPEPIGDSIFAVAAEEFGFVGSVILVGLFLALAWRGFYLSAKAPDFFGRLLGSGLVILMVIGTFLNLAALTGLLPLTGIPLLFVSQGGSALAVALAEVGILLNISKRNL